MGKVLRKRMAGLYVVVVCILLLSFYTVTFQAASRQSGCQGDDKESCPLQQERRNFQRLFERGSFPNSGGNFKNLSQRKASYEEDSLDFAERNIALQPKNYEAVEFLDKDLKKVGEHSTISKKSSKIFPLMDADDSFMDNDLPRGLNEQRALTRKSLSGNPSEVKQSKSQVLNIKQEGTFGHHTEVKQGKSQVLDIKQGGASLGNPTEVKQGNIPDFKPKPERTVGIREFPPLYRPVLPNGLNCSRVWHGDGMEARRAMQEMNDTSAARRPPGFYGTITDNCQLYRKQNG
ncbi:uncharacterized protein [Littorina saxatilis]|uniref:uncharacterized protein n=1 Tax=Littorina saxatilis TaxID=31220 RepID=UPI0038B54D33